MEQASSFFILLLCIWSCSISLALPTGPMTVHVARGSCVDSDIRAHFEKYHESMGLLRKDSSPLCRRKPERCDTRSCTTSPASVSRAQKSFRADGKTHSLVPCSDVPDRYTIEAYWGYCRAVDEERPCNYLVVIDDPIHEILKEYLDACSRVVSHEKGFLDYARDWSNHYTRLYSHDTQVESGAVNQHSFDQALKNLAAPHVTVLTTHHNASVWSQIVDITRLEADREESHRVCELPRIDQHERCKVSTEDMQEAKSINMFDVRLHHELTSNKNKNHAPKKQSINDNAITSEVSPAASPGVGMKVKGSPRFKKLGKSARRPPPGKSHLPNGFLNEVRNPPTLQQYPIKATPVPVPVPAPVPVPVHLPVSDTMSTTMTTEYEHVTKKEANSHSQGGWFMILFGLVAMIGLLTSLKSKSDIWLPHVVTCWRWSGDIICRIKSIVIESAAFKSLQTQFWSLYQRIIESELYQRLQAYIQHVMESEACQRVLSLKQRIVNSPTWQWLYLKALGIKHYIVELPLWGKLSEVASSVKDRVSESELYSRLYMVVRVMNCGKHEAAGSAVDSVSALGELRNDLSAFLAAAKLSHHENRLRELGFAEPLDLIGVEDADLRMLKVPEKKRLLRALSQISGINRSTKPDKQTFLQLFVGMVIKSYYQFMAYLDRFLALFGGGPQQFRSPSPRPPRAPPPSTLSSALYGGNSRGGKEAPNRPVDDLHRRHAAPNEKNYRNSYELLGDRSGLDMMEGFQASFDLLDEDHPRRTPAPPSRQKPPISSHQINNKKVTFNQHDQVRSIPPRPVPQSQFHGMPRFDESR